MMRSHGQQWRLRITRQQRSSHGTGSWRLIAAIPVFE